MVNPDLKPPFPDPKPVCTCVKPGVNNLCNDCRLLLKGYVHGRSEEIMHRQWINSMMSGGPEVYLKEKREWQNTRDKLKELTDQPELIKTLKAEANQLQDKLDDQKKVIWELTYRANKVKKLEEQIQKLTDIATSNRVELEKLRKFKEEFDFAVRDVRKSLVGKPFAGRVPAPPTRPEKPRPEYRRLIEID